MSSIDLELQLLKRIFPSLEILNTSPPTASEVPAAPADSDFGGSKCIGGGEYVANIAVNLSASTSKDFLITIFPRNYYNPRNCTVGENVSSIRLYFNLPIEYPQGQINIAIVSSQNLCIENIEDFKARIQDKTVNISSQGRAVGFCYELVIAAQNLLMQYSAVSDIVESQDRVSFNIAADEVLSCGEDSEQGGGECEVGHDNDRTDGLGENDGIYNDANDYEDDNYYDDYDEENDGYNEHEGYYDEYDEEMYDYEEDYDKYEMYDGPPLAIKATKKSTVSNAANVAYNPWTDLHTVQYLMKSTTVAAPAVASVFPLECPICLSNIVDAADMAKCKTCLKYSCSFCFQSFLLTTRESPKCMFLCKSDISQQSVLELSLFFPKSAESTKNSCKFSSQMDDDMLPSVAQSKNNSWYNLIYGPHRKDVLMRIESGRLPSSQLAARSFITAKEWVKGYSGSEKECLVQDFFLRCIDSFGRGFEDLDNHLASFKDSNLKSKKDSHFRQIHFACPQSACRGWIYVDSEQQSIASNEKVVACLSCKSTICFLCREIVVEKIATGEDSHKQALDLAVTTIVHEKINPAATTNSIAPAHHTIAESGECCTTIYVENLADSISKNNMNVEEFTAKIGGASTATVKMGKKTPKHVCNSDTLASIEAVSSEAKPCPKCHAFISKVSGCDQMFCTKCYTTYSWCTGEIAPENSFRHNPHYLDWVRSTQYAGATHKNNNANYNDWNRNNFAANRMSLRQDIINARRLQAADRYAQGAFLQVTHDHRGELDLGRVFSCSIKRRFPFSTPATRYNPLSCEEHYGFIFLAMHRQILDIRANSGNHANARPVVTI